MPHYIQCIFIYVPLYVGVYFLKYIYLSCSGLGKSKIRYTVGRNREWEKLPKPNQLNLKNTGIIQFTKCLSLLLLLWQKPDWKQLMGEWINFMLYVQYSINYWVISRPNLKEGRNPEARAKAQALWERCLLACISQLSQPAFKVTQESCLHYTQCFGGTFSREIQSSQIWQWDAAPRAKPSVVTFLLL